jgi:hypothetical protein
MPIPQGTEQLVELGEVAKRLGTTREAVKHWWKRDRLLGRVTQGRGRRRIMVPIEVVQYYLRYFRLPTRLDLYKTGTLSRRFLLELEGPDGGLSELEQQDGAASESGALLTRPSP